MVYVQYLSSVPFSFISLGNIPVLIIRYRVPVPDHLAVVASLSLFWSSFHVNSLPYYFCCCIFLGGLLYVGHSFAYVDHFVFLRDVWILTHIIVSHVRQPFVSSKTADFIA